MSSNYGYKPSNASTFNQLIQQGITVEEASKQSGVSTNAGQYGYGTNSNAGSVIPGGGGTADASGLINVPYRQSGTGEPGQQPAQANSPAPSTFQDPAQRAAAAAAQADSRIISSTPAAGSLSGYGTGINNPSVAPVAAAETTTSPYSAFNQVQTVPQPLQTPASEPSPFAGDPAQRGNQRATEQAATINANTSGLPVVNEEGTVAQGIRTNPETGETYYTDPPAGAADTQVKSFSAADVSAASLGKPGESLQAQAAAAAGSGSTPIGAEIATPASNTESGRLLAQRQAALAAQKKLVNNNGDWRVRISLAENSDYLYNAPFPDLGILAPLKATYGVIFPYTPKIDIGYKATYSTADLTHSNYRNYFYQGSAVDSFRISGTFTAQDTVEADYLLAVIHFFRSATKMFYGQDAQRGAPPPLLFVSGLGEYQFNNQACVLAGFEYSLPADVDYIRAGSPNNNGTDLLKRRTSTQNNLPTNAFSGALSRLNQLFSGQGIQKGGIVYQNAPSNLSKNSPTYVPTKIDITLSLHPIVTRSQASKQFSLKQFANGDLVKQGFW